MFFKDSGESLSLENGSLGDWARAMAIGIFHLESSRESLQIFPTLNPRAPLSIPPSLARARERPAVSSPPQRCPGAAVLGNPRSFNLHSSAASRRYIPVAAPAAYSSSANLKLLPVQASIPDGCVGRLPHRRERLPL
jgi:hypothetical protein